MDTINLIKGSFTPLEAQDILLDVINKKIKFHNLKSLSSQVRLGKPDIDSEIRIEELVATRDYLITIIQAAKNEGCDLVIESTINIAFEPKNQLA
jgi:hypothetical protein